MILKWHNKENLILGVQWIKRFFLFIIYRQINLLIFQKFLFCYVIKCVQKMRPGMLKSFTVIDFILKLFNLLRYLSFPQFNLLFPSLSWIKSLIVFSKIKTSIIKTFRKIFVRYIFASFIEFLFAFIKFLHFLVKSWKYYIFCNCRLRYHDIEDVLVRIYFCKKFL